RDPATSVAPSATPATAPSKRPSRRGSLSAAVHGRRLAHHEILANHKPESPERGDGRLARSSSADAGRLPINGHGARVASPSLPLLPTGCRLCACRVPKGDVEGRQCPD